MSVSADRIVKLSDRIKSIKNQMDAARIAIEALDRDEGRYGSGRTTVHVGNASATFERKSWVVMAFRNSLEARIRRGEAQLARIEKSLKEVGHD